MPSSSGHQPDDRAPVGCVGADFRGAGARLFRGLYCDWDLDPECFEACGCPDDRRMHLMERTIAILCSGQGRQHAGMFDLLAECLDAEPVFAAARQHLHEDPRRFVREVPYDTLFKDNIGQILCCTRALAVWAGLGKACPARAVIAGYSVGELAAWGCAGSLDATATLQLAAQRASFMDAVAPPD